MKTKDIPYYSLIFGIFILLKLAFRQMDNDALLFLLAPTNSLIELVTNSTSLYENATGFYHEKHHIFFNKSCSGFNFWLLCFLMLSSAVLPYLASSSAKLLAIPAMLILAYIGTIFANTSRVIVSLFLEATPLGAYGWLHQAEGIFIYFFFFVLFYLGFKSILQRFF